MDILKEAWDWFSMAFIRPMTSEELAESAVTEIKALVISRGVFKQLAELGEEITRNHGWGDRSQRQADP